MKKNTYIVILFIMFIYILSLCGAILTIFKRQIFDTFIISNAINQAIPLCLIVIISSLYTLSFLYEGRIMLITVSVFSILRFLINHIYLLIIGKINITMYEVIALVPFIFIIIFFNIKKVKEEFKIMNLNNITDFNDHEKKIYEKILLIIFIFFLIFFIVELISLLFWGSIVLVNNKNIAVIALPYLLILIFTLFGCIKFNNYARIMFKTMIIFLFFKFLAIGINLVFITKRYATDIPYFIVVSIIFLVLITLFILISNRKAKIIFINKDNESLVSEISNEKGIGS